VLTVLLLLLYDTFRAASWPALMSVGLGPLGLSSSALSLLLVFRTNSSAARFDEARRLWGSIVNRSRDLVRQALVYFPATPQGQELKGALVRWVVALAHCVRLHMRAPRSRSAAPQRGAPCASC
jgi:predicted membrane chloride channel (bestrophin family)